MHRSACLSAIVAVFGLLFLSACGGGESASSDGDTGQVVVSGPDEVLGAARAALGGLLSAVDLKPGHVAESTRVDVTDIVSTYDDAEASCRAPANGW